MSRSAKLLRSGPALAAVAFLCLAGTSPAAPKRPAAAPPKGAPAKGKSHGVSRESFNMITEGMTLADAQRIVGHAGKQKAQFQNPTYGDVITWIWGDEKKNIRVNLARGRVIGKYENGLSNKKK